MQYAQLNTNNSFKEFKTNTLTLWDVNNYCTPEALIKDGKADQFKIVTVVDTPQPVYDATTERILEVDPIQINSTWTQQWSVEPLSAQQIATNQANLLLQAREAAKAIRTAAVENIKVTTSAGNTFDGDEVSQGRMARAIIALSTGLELSVTWVLANNSTIEATPAELTEALILSGQAQAAIWVI